MTWKAVEYMGG